MAITHFTSSNSFQGYHITQQFDFCSGFGQFIDEDGNPASFSMAKERAMQQMLRAVPTEANAIIGFRVEHSIGSYVHSDYNNCILTNLITCVLVSGTPVRMEKDMEQKMEKVLLVMDYPPALPIRPYLVTLIPGQNESTLVQLRFFSYTSEPISALQADIVLRTVFGEDIVLPDIGFARIRAQDGEHQTGFFRVNLSDSLFSAQSASVRIKKYVCGSALREGDVHNQRIDMRLEDLFDLKRLYGNDAVAPHVVYEGGWQCLCGAQNPTDEKTCPYCQRGGESRQVAHASLLRQAEELHSACEILACLQAYEAEHKGSLPLTFMEGLEKMASTERMFGNMKKECMKFLHEHLEAEEAAAPADVPDLSEEDQAAMGSDAEIPILTPNPTGDGDTAAPETEEDRFTIKSPFDDPYWK
ncbi:hypothetical protein [Zongyangia hominis]|uniref:Uncharacterized protein n=1 Tax=Zongyangia hominis TaxID=2763677 RepID=A0A926EE92_9FIRM|nr:hypothetical protein [Zongyangia hominis]MBC8570829.1 hypothetical protein [Zongyangia hominis]